MAEGGVISNEIKWMFQSVSRNRTGPRTLLCGIPASIGRVKGPIESHTLATRMEEVTKRAVLALDAIGRVIGEQCRVPDCIECSRYRMS